MENKEITFDIVTFKVGDKVISKNKEPSFGKKVEVETIIETDIGETPNYTFQLLYFESNPDDACVAFEYEPNDPIELEEFNRIILEKVGTLQLINKGIRTLRKKKIKAITKKEETKIKNFLKDGEH